MPKNTTRTLVFTAMIAAIYTALCMALAPIGFGSVQLRVSEALTLLPVLSPIGIWGVTLGCALSNLIGVITGTDMLGLMDIPFGTAATLLAALVSRGTRHIRWHGVPVVSAIPPVLFNAVIVGAELAYMTSAGEGFAKMFLINVLQVGAGQLVACFVLGLPLVCVLERTGAARACFGSETLPR